MAKKYIIVEVFDREIDVYQYDNLDEAKRDLRKAFNDVVEEHDDLVLDNDYSISDDGTLAFVSIPFGDHYDWMIEEII